MTTKEANAIDMVSYLSMWGFEPAKSNGNDYWYYSPFRDETEPSFKVNRSRNQWYDFGLGKDGNIVDLLVHWKRCSVAEALSLLQAHEPNRPLMPLPVTAHRPTTEMTPTIEVLSEHLISSPKLVIYCRQRRIDWAIADQFLGELRYRIAGKIYNALGFKNDAGGYELRSAFFKGSSHPQSPTWFRHGAASVAVFEDVFDFLSFLTLHRFQPAPTQDYLVLNSTSFFDRELPNMQAYNRVHLYLDNDSTGSKCTARATQLSAVQFIDERTLYQGYKGLNEWCQQIGLSRKNKDAEKGYPD